MTRIFDFGGRDVERSVTVAGLQALKGSGRHVAQVTADTVDEAAAAEAAGVEMVVCRAANVARVRDGSKRVFVTAALGFSEAVTRDEVLRAAFAAVTAGADAVITGRSLSLVNMLADEQIPVMGHLGFVPRKSTWIGGIRAVGKTASEALDLVQRFRRLEDAGAFAVECEVIAAPVMAEINRRTGLVTVSLGSGPDADVIFLFSADVCGEAGRMPRHARAFGDLNPLHQTVRDARVRAFTAFRTEVEHKTYPASGEIVTMPSDEEANFFHRLPAGSSTTIK